MAKATRRARSRASALAACAGGCALVGCAPSASSFLGYEDAAAALGLDVVDARGVCIVDLDGDGDADVLFTREAGPQLLENRGGDGFVDASVAWGMPGPGQWLGCGAADLDGDRDADVVLTDHDGPTLLLRNDTGRLVDATEAAGLSGSRRQGSVAFGDLDADGVTDLLLSGVAAGESRAYRGLGDGTFEDVSARLNLPTLERSWSAAIFDATNDGLPEIFLATDVAGSPPGSSDRLLLNLGELVFVDVTGEFELADASDGMGIAVGDVDEDAFLDFYVTNIGPHFLWRNLAGGVFLNATTAARVDNGGGRVGWGTFFVDADEDGGLDLFVANGGYYSRGTTEPIHDGPDRRNRLFLREHGDAEFARFEDAAGRLGLDDAGSALGAAWGDLDGDGVLDLVVANQGGGTAAVARGLGHADGDPGALRLLLEGRTGPREAWGARLAADVCGATRVRFVGTGPSVFSQGERVVHLPLGGCEATIRLSILWPGGLLEELDVVPRGRDVVTIVEGDGE